MSFGKFLAQSPLIIFHQVGDTRFQISGDQLATQLANIPIIGVDVGTCAKAHVWAPGWPQPEPTAQHLGAILLSGHARAASLIKYIAL